MKTYYHVTLTKNLPSIFAHGLIPKIGELSQITNEIEERVYLFPSLDDMETALCNWLGEQLEDLYGEDVQCCSLKITLPEDFVIIEGEVEYECYSYSTIDKKYISYFREE